MKIPTNMRGFTIIEISIVLVVIGLIVGGITTGQSMIRQTRINSIPVDAQKYISAATQFKEKYGALPGDFSSATSYWSSATNGDGDGQVDFGAEEFGFWQQMAFASLIEGKYSGAAGSGGTREHMIGTNSPESKIKGGGYGVEYIGTQTASGTFFDANYGNTMYFGGFVATTIPIKSIITGIEAYNIDLKLDDGLPAYGNIMSIKSGTGYNSCTTTAVSATSAYNSSSSSNICSLIFITGF